MKYAFINRHRRVWPISLQCRVLEASVAGHHEPFVRAASAAQRRHLRTYKELLARGVRVGKERVQKLMQLRGIRAKGKLRFKVTMRSNHPGGGDRPVQPPSGGLVVAYARARLSSTRCAWRGSSVIRVSKPG